MTRSHFPWILCAAIMFMAANITCSGDTPATPAPTPYDPLKPAINSFTAKRGNAALTNGIVYSGEDINLAVDATSQAWPQSCGLNEGDVVTGNLLYTFKVIPPDNVPAPGLVSQSTPPSDKAIWRVPNLDEYDKGEGLMYSLQVTVFDECLDRATTGSITVRAFANQGAPVITSTKVQSDIKLAKPVEEMIDQDGYYEVELGDECRITITADSRTSDDICKNRGVKTGDELRYEWSSTFESVNLVTNGNPNHAFRADFDIPANISVGSRFDVECVITDECTGTKTVSTFSFVIVSAPRIASFEVTANGINLPYDPYFDTFEMLPGNKIVLTVRALYADSDICAMKGIDPPLQYHWQETSGTKPTLNPDYTAVPTPNGLSSIAFVVPAVSNGVSYNFQVAVTDRCNGLTDTESGNFMVIVPPTAAVTFVKRNTETINPATGSGRYEVNPGDLITIRVTATAKSNTSFCQERGISQSPPVRYYWENPWGDLLILNYNIIPAGSYSDLVFLLPDNTPPIDATLSGTVTDMCNGLEAAVNVPFRVLEDED